MIAEEIIGQELCMGLPNYFVKDHRLVREWGWEVPVCKTRRAPSLE